jgi:diamine N-acetyltransferase
MSNQAIYLRAIEPEDLELLYTIENAPELWNITNNDGPYSRFALKQYIASQPTSIFENGLLRLIACKTETEQAIGIVDLIDYNALHQRAEISIALLKEEQQKGYGKLIIQEIEQWAQKKFNIRTLYAYTLTNQNAAGKRLFLSMSYQECGTLKSWHFDGKDFTDITIFQKILQKK